MKKSIGMKILRGVGITFAVLLVLLIILVVTAKFWLGATIKTAVNNLGPKYLGVPVEVESVSVSIIDGKVRLNTLTIGNPEGFESTPYLFRLDGFSIDLSVKELLQGKTHIYDLIIDGPHVWYHKTLTSSNVSRLLEILEEKYPSGDNNGAEEKKEDENQKEEAKVEDGGDAQPVVIDHLLVKKGTIGLKMGIGGEVPLLEIELKDVGKDGAMMPWQIVKLLASSIVKGVLSAVANVGGAAIEAVGDVGGAAVDAGKAAVGAVGDAGKAAVGAVGDAGKAAAGAVGSVAKGIGSLFGSSSETNAPAEK